MAGSRTPRRILIVRPSALGDVCRTVPVLVSLRAAYPEAEIDWVVRDSFAAAIAAHPAIHRAIPFPRARFARWWRSPLAAREMARWFLDLRRHGYDLVIDFQGLGRSGLITWFTAARRRVGPRRARELAWLGYNVRHVIPPAVHTVDAMLGLLRAEGVEPIPDLRLYVGPADRSWWADRRREAGFGAAPYAVLAPTARWASKRWPVACWVELASALTRRGYERLIVIGGRGERDQVAGLADGVGAGDASIVDLVGRTTVGHTMAIVSDARLVVANDSAPLHMAVGLDRPCVGLFGPTDPGRVGPYGRPEAVVRAPGSEDGGRISYRDRRLDDTLMRAITVERVLDRVDDVVSVAPAPIGTAAVAAGDVAPGEAGG